MEEDEEEVMAGLQLQRQLDLYLGHTHRHNHLVHMNEGGAGKPLHSPHLFIEGGAGTVMSDSCVGSVCECCSSRLGVDHLCTQCTHTTPEEFILFFIPSFIHIPPVHTNGWME